MERAVVRFADKYRYRFEAGQLGGSPAAFPADYYIAGVAFFPDRDGLYQTERLYRVGQLLQSVFVEGGTRLFRVGHYQRYGYLLHLSGAVAELGPFAFENGVQTASQSFVLHIKSFSGRNIPPRPVYSDNYCFLLRCMNSLARFM